MQFYAPKCPERKRELDYVISKNLRNCIFNHFTVYTDHISDASCLSSMDPATLNTILLDRRLTYSDWISQTSFNHSIHGSHLSLLANSDIFFDYSLKDLLSWTDEKTFFAISRYENFKLILNPEVSQDSWGIYSSSLDNKSININNFKSSSSMSLGYLGCDNRIAAVAYESGYNIVNPCNSVYSHHLQKSKERSYSESTRLLGSYLFSEPAQSDDLKQSSRYIMAYFGKSGLLALPD